MPDEAAATSRPASTDPTVVEGGTVWVLRMLDVAEQIDLDVGRQRMENSGARRGESRIRGPEKGAGGLLLTTEPLDVETGKVTLGGIEFRTSVRVFDFGTASVRFAYDIRPGTECSELVRLAAGIERLEGVDAAAREIWDRLSTQLGGRSEGVTRPSSSRTTCSSRSHGFGGQGTPIRPSPRSNRPD